MNGARSDSVVVDGVTIRYREVAGDGPPIVFVHGIYVGGSLWSGVVERLAGRRCIVPTWPHGAHADPAPDADLGARAAARRIPALLEALDLDDVTLVGNDTGGGLCLAALASGHPGVDRIGRLALTNCDSYEHFPPKGFDTLIRLMNRSPAAGRLVLRLLATRGGQHFFLRAVTVDTPRGPSPVFEAFATSPVTRRDALRFSRSLEPSVTLDAAPAIRAFDRPVLLVWGDRDDLFPVAHAERLATEFPDATLRVVPGASTFVMLDRPDEVAAALRAF